MACEVRTMENDSRTMVMRTIAGHIEDSLENASAILKRFGSPSGMVTLVYLFVKLLYTINCVAQLFLLKAFLGGKDLLHLYRILLDLMNGDEWTDSGNFPRVTMCDFEVKVLGNVQRHTVQCVLPINMFNEKMFLFLWFWCTMVSALTAASFAHWMFLCLLPSQSLRFIRKYLLATDLVSDRPTEKRFIQTFLGYDGVFCLRMVSAHAGEIAATELVVALWRSFRDRRQTSPSRFDNAPSADSMRSSRFIRKREITDDYDV